MMHVSLIQLGCIGLMTFGLGLFTGMFLLGWFEERSDRYTGITWSKEWEPSPWRFP